MTICGRLQFKGDDYLSVATIQGWLLFEGSDYLRVATIQGDYLRAVFIPLGSPQTSMMAG